MVDDQSTDGTLEIARQFERLDPRVRIVANERNLGQFAVIDSLCDALVMGRPFVDLLA